MEGELNAAIELHDSVLGSVKQEGSVLLVTLTPAYVHKSQGKPGFSDGIGVVQDLVLEFRNGRFERELGELPTDIFEGRLLVGSAVFENMIELPFETAEPVKLQVTLSPDAREVAFFGDGLKVQSLGEPAYVEPFTGIR